MLNEATPAPSGPSQHTTESRVSRRVKARRAIERQVWNDEVPGLIPEALSEAMQPPGKHSPAYAEECKRIHGKRETLARILREYPIEKLVEGIPYGSPARTFLNTLYPDVRWYCDAHVNEETVARLYRAGL